MTITNLNQEIRDLCDADSTSLTDAMLLRRVNSAMETIIAKIINADGTWQFDDTNYTNNPIGRATLLEGVSSYNFTDEFLDIENVKVLTTTAGVWRFLQPIDQSQNEIPLENYLLTSGFPLYYDKNGDNIRLYPAPTATQVTLTNGLKVQFKRTASLFTAAEVTTGTKEPGIASPFHQLIAYMAALPYCLSYKKDRVPLFEKKIMDMTKDCLSFYASREKDTRKVMTMACKNFR